MEQAVRYSMLKLRGCAAILTIAAERPTHLCRPASRTCPKLDSLRQRQL